MSKWEKILPEEGWIFSINPIHINIYGVNRGQKSRKNFSRKTTFAGPDSSSSRP